MAKRDAGEAFLEDLLAEDGSDADSDWKPDDSVASTYTGGDSVFCDLSVGSGDVVDVYGQPLGRDGDESDSDEDAAASVSGVPRAITTRDDHENRAARRLAEMASSQPPRPPAPAGDATAPRNASGTMPD